MQADGDSDAALEYMCCLLVVNYWIAQVRAYKGT